MSPEPVDPEAVGSAPSRLGVVIGALAQPMVHVVGRDDTTGVDGERHERRGVRALPDSAHVTCDPGAGNVQRRSSSAGSITSTASSGTYRSE